MDDKTNKKSGKVDRTVIREMKTSSQTSEVQRRGKGATTSGTPPLRKPNPGKPRQ